ncbi:MAG: hypothetical protein ABSE77_13090 [Acidimicrobiales bacterium]
MSRIVSVDLDNPDPRDVERLWNEINRLHKVRGIDPELREGILRQLSEAVSEARLGEVEASTIRAELDRDYPSAVLSSHWRQIIRDRPALGAFPRRKLPHVPTPEEWLREDPSRLAGVVAEMRHFGINFSAIVQAAVHLADCAGIDTRKADQTIAKAVWELRGGVRSVG